MGWASRSTDPAAAAAAEERRRRWREENPTPDELGDSFGSLFSDLASAVGQVVRGSGDWLSLLDELQLAEGAELQALLRSTDAAALRDELESTRFILTSLSNRMERLDAEAKAAVADAEAFRRDAAAGGSSASSMARSLERELERDLRRRRERLQDARRLLEQARSREKRIAARLEDLRNGPQSSTRSQNRGRALPSVEEELEQLKRKMGR